MSGSDYLFCIQDKSNNFYKLDNNGMVILSSVPYFLVFSPSGWEDIAIQNIRNKKYWGVDRSVTLPLSYIEDGAKILKYLFYTFGIEQNVYLSILSQQLYYEANVSYGYYYKRIFKSEIDFISLLHNSSKVTCTTLEDGLPKYLKSNENTDNEYPLNVIEAVNIKMDGIDLRQGLGYYNVDNLDIAVGYLKGSLLPCENISIDGNSTGIQINSQQYQDININDNFFNASQNNYLIKNTNNFAVTFKVSGVLDFFCNSKIATQAGGSIRFGISNNGNQIQNIGITSLLYFNEGQIYNFVYDLNITLNQNDVLFMFFPSFITGTSCTLQFTQNSKFNINFATRFKTTFIKGFSPQYLFEKLISNLTDNTYTAAISKYLHKYRDIIFTCGDAIRGKLDAKIKMSWADFFQFWDSFDSIGIIEIEKKINIDKKENLVDVNSFIDLNTPIIDTFKVDIAKEYLFNELEIGYPELSNEVGLLNATQEFNTKVLFSFGTSKGIGRLDKVSKIIASCYEIEALRINTFQKDTSDNKQDNKIFVIHVEKTLQPSTENLPAHYKLDRSLNSTATGLLEKNTVFNIFLSPKRNILRNSSFLASCQFKSMNRLLEFKKSDRNSEMQADGIIEKKNEPMINLDPAFFYPIYFYADFAVDENILDKLAINPLQVFRFELNNTFYKGIIVKASVLGNKKSSQSYQMLSIAGNDLTKLIDYYG